MKKIEVTLRASGRLDRVLLDSWPEEEIPSRAQIARWIKAGYVVGPKEVFSKAGAQVEEGAVLWVQLPLPDVVVTSIDPANYPDVIFADEDIVVVNKPAGLVVHPGAGTKGVPTLSELLAPMGFNIQAGESGRPGIVHRLDKDTSGVMVIARSARAHASLSEQFADRNIQKGYLAVVMETPRRRSIFGVQDEGVIDLPVGRDPKSRVRMCTDQGRPAYTEWKVVERFSRGVLLALRPKTGRTHQIRVHCFANLAPIYGDVLYRRNDLLDSEIAAAERSISRQALHAEMLSFIHPGSGKRVSFNAILPRDIESLVAFLRRQNSS
jgi:23S rRNA pseudouridine1911/1915/1917 synthase